MSSISVAMSSQGYQYGHQKGRCSNCRHAANTEGLRCQVGHFWVRAACGCERFEDRLPPAVAAAAAPAAEPRIQIGPLDV
jgi:hypothetical protein